MEERGCFSCGCGCFGTVITMTILLLLLVCGLIFWAIIGLAGGQYQLDFGVQLLTVLLPVI